MSIQHRPVTRGRRAAGPRPALVVTELEARLVPATPVTGNAQFVEQVYRDLLGRDLDPAGTANWVAKLNAGASEQSVVTGILESGERATDVVQTIYAQYLHRAADPTGLSYATGLLATGDSPEDVAARLVGSAEFSALPGNATAAGFLAALFQDALNRPVDPSGQASLTAQLAAGESRAAVAAEVIQSAEARQNFVQSEYINLLGRASDPAGMAGFVGALQNGGTDDQAVAGFLTSTEYTGVAAASGFGAGTFFLQDTGVQKSELGSVSRTFSQINTALGGNSPAGQLAADYQAVASDVAGLQQLFAPLVTAGGALDLGSAGGQEVVFDAQSFSQADKFVVSRIDPSSSDDDLSSLNSVTQLAGQLFYIPTLLGQAKAAISNAVSKVSFIPVVGDFASAFNSYASALLTVMSAEGEIGTKVVSGTGVIPTDTLAPLVTAQAQQLIQAGTSKLIDAVQKDIPLTEDEKAIEEKFLSFLDDSEQTVADMAPSAPGSAFSQLQQQQPEIEQNLPNTPAVPDPDAAIQVSPSTIEAEVKQGDASPTPVTVEITNDGGSGSELNPTVSVGGTPVASVQEAEPPAVAAGSSESVAVDLDTEGTPVGTDYGTAVISDPNSDQGMYVVPVVIVVDPGSSPTPVTATPAAATPAAPAPVTPTPVTPVAPAPTGAVTGIAITNISVQAAGGTTVSVGVTPAVSGVSVSYSVSGTDGFTTSGTAQTDANGNASFSFASGSTGVTDTITVQTPNGISATRTFTY